MHVMVPEADAPVASGVAARVLPGGDAERAMFGVAMRFAGAGDRMVGCSTLLTEAQRKALLEAFEMDGVRASWALMRADDEEIVGASDGMIAVTGRRWAWDDTLAAAGCVAATEVGDG